MFAFIFKSLALAKHFKRKLINENHLPYKNYIHKQDFNQMKAKKHWKKYKAKHYESVKLPSITKYKASRMTQVYLEQKILWIQSKQDQR